MKAHLFKVALSFDKRTYRRIACLDTDSLEELHNEIFRAFDRYDEHLYSFYFPVKPTKSLSTIRHSPAYCHSYVLEEDELPNHNCAFSASIASLGLTPKQKCYYLFDYGDQWWHEITYEGVGECPETAYPVTIARKGESPPQYPDYEE
uniref:PRiA4b ORF-3-like protein n=1 Tax=Candidatus Kentrum sp. FM TaxID=2126340 RepID=A0A450TG77_9GAMM|nr:MAG: pRiA4b ORF-3-like protein [Candidatus Kentron sp. FM]VFJ66281.1 MAG: pRiA4b ORF-3-like protein [Candidatus Kentron sp. FM]VFK09249.1 MAG: pRiA4b ORF-3-like protein [Candidatus Kentron sp. FM]